MKNRIRLSTATALGLTALLAVGGLLAQAPAPPPDSVPPDPVQQPAAPDASGVEQLLRGPVHEAFAQPDTANPQPSPIVPKRPPDGVDELPPNQRPEGANVTWIPGYWAWEEDAADFLWVSGFWRDVPPDRQWMPGYWVAAEGGWQWIPGYWNQAGLQDVNYLPPPPQSLESGPSAPAPQEDMIYVSGIWMYQQTRYLWRPGFWARAYPNWAYVPARYLWTPAGCVFVNGYWDYPLARRGMLFCPVRFDPVLLARPQFYYQPSYALAAPALVNSLFVATDFHRYQFGDYYGAEYARRGVVPWFRYQVARGVVSPTFAHYRWEHRANPAWATNLERVYTDRERGLAPRPAVTVVQQQRMIQNLTVNNTVIINNKTVTVNNAQTLVRNLRVAAPVTQVAKLNGVKLQAVPQAAHAQERVAAMQIRESAAKRRDVELKLVTEGHRPTRPTDKARTAKVEMSRPVRPAVVPARAPLPAAPRLPAHVERPLPKHEPAVPKQIAPAAVRPNPAPGPRPAVSPQPPAPRPDPKTKPTPPAPKQEPAPRPKTEVKPTPPAPAPLVRPQPPRPEAKAPAAQPHPAPAAPRPQPPAAQPLPAPARPAAPPAPAPQVRPPAPQPNPAPRPAAAPAGQPPHPAPAPAAHPAPARPAAPPAPQLRPAPPAPRPAAAPAGQPPHPAPTPAAHPAPAPAHPAPPPAVRPQPRPAPPPPRHEPLPHPKP